MRPYKIKYHAINPSVLISDYVKYQYIFTKYKPLITTLDKTKKNSLRFLNYKLILFNYV